MATALVLRPRLAVNVTVLLTPRRLVDILHLKHWGNGLRNSGVSSMVSSHDYLVSSLCISPDSDDIIRKSRPCSIMSTEKADSVISLFKDYSFDQTRMLRIFSLYPELLTFDPERVLKPKLDCLLLRGITTASLVGIINSNPSILTRNDPLDLELASILLDKRTSRFFHCFSETNTPANVDVLRRHGVPDAHILKLAVSQGTLGLEAGYFSSVVREILEMGFEPRGLNFIHGVRVLAGMSKDKWVSKVALLAKCFRWTDQQEVAVQFIKSPHVFASSEDKLMQNFEMLTTRMGWTPDDIAKRPTLLCYSLEARILPRFSVLQALVSKGLVSKITMVCAYTWPEHRFLDRFVIRCQKDLPQLMDIYANSKGLNIRD